jgi:hypothetical protein
VVRAAWKLAINCRLDAVLARQHQRHNREVAMSAVENRMNVCVVLVSLLSVALAVGCGTQGKPANLSVASDFDCPPLPGDAPRPDLSEALVAGDEAAATAFNCEFLRGNLSVTSALLHDSR